MTAPVWLKPELVIAIHEEQLRQYGGSPGLHDRGLLESALARPVNKWSYENEADLARLAASIAFGIARNHPFVDGNKRAALLALVTFLELNGTSFLADEAEAVVMIRDLAAGAIGEAELAMWIRDVAEGRRPRLAR
mgnify:CR=1 FL=1